MAENCTHDCSTCSSDCADRSAPQSFLVEQNSFSDIGKIIGVVSGKGGVGKSLVTSLLACEMRKRGYYTGIIDADITGPSIPRSFGLSEKAMSDGTYIYPSVSKKGTKVVSMNLLLENENDPVVWRGPVIAGAVKQFYTDVAWDKVEYMFVDMPPGTGDVPLTVFQSLPIAGIVVVTSPQELVSMIVEKAVKMAGMMNIPVLGIVENMSYFECPDCGKKHFIFGESHLEELAGKYGIQTISRLPIDTELAKKCDSGCVEEYDSSVVKEIADSLEELK